MASRFLLAVIFMILITCSGAEAAEPTKDWSAWRGPEANGHDGKHLVASEFGPEACDWKVTLPGRGCSTPIVTGQRIVLTAPIEGRDAVICYDLDGQQKWRTTFGEENAGKHRNGSGCNASPVSDGEAVYVYFKSGTFAAVDMQGKVVWQTNLVKRFGPDTLFWDHGTSPVLTENYVIMARMHHGDSWLAAFDKLTGEIAWKVGRNFQTPTEGDHGYTTPVVLRHQGRESILVWGAEHVTIHNADDGQVVWSCGNFNPERRKLWPAIASPVLVDGVAVIAYGRNDRGIPRLHGVRLAGSGDVTGSAHLWQRDDVGTFVPTPAIHDARVVVVGDQGEVSCVLPETGETLWQGKFPKSRAKYYASPFIAGDRLYAPREDGVVMVASIANDHFELLAQNDMEESIIGSPIPVGDRLLLRGESHLFCIGD